MTGEVAARRLRLLEPYDNSFGNWVKAQPDWQTAWATCRQGDDLVWVLAKQESTKRTAVRVACELIRLVLPSEKLTGRGWLNDLPFAEQWAAGGGTLPSSWEVVAHTTCPVSLAASTAGAAAYSRFKTAAARVEAERKVMDVCADLVRKHHPTAPELPER